MFPYQSTRFTLLFLRHHFIHSSFQLGMLKFNLLIILENSLSLNFMVDVNIFNHMCRLIIIICFDNWCSLNIGTLCILNKLPLWRICAFSTIYLLREPVHHFKHKYIQTTPVLSQYQYSHGFITLHSPEYILSEVDHYFQPLKSFGVKFI